MYQLFVLLVRVDRRPKVKIVLGKRLQVNVVAELAFGMNQIVHGSLSFGKVVVGLEVFENMACRKSMD